MKTSKNTRKTRHQEAVLQLFENSDRALTADEIRSGITEKINKTTVYRMLERFINAGKVHCITGEDGKAFYALCKDCKNDHEDKYHNHLHFQCRYCGMVECLPQKVEVPNLTEYEINETQFLLIGSCMNCKKTINSSSQ